jgi:hypothetical protein
MNSSPQKTNAKIMTVLRFFPENTTNGENIATKIEIRNGTAEISG